jgi:excisionase family DNA binding protein
MKKVKYLSTGEVAVILGVTRATVVHWINTGKLSADKTPGKHNRINQKELRGLLPAVFNARGLGIPVRKYCWEFFSKGRNIPPTCESCIVFRTRAAYCYIFANEVGHGMLHCSTSCAKCRYARIAKPKSGRGGDSR